METTPVLGYNVFSSRLDAIDPEIDKLLINTFKIGRAHV